MIRLSKTKEIIRFIKSNHSKLNSAKAMLSVIKDLSEDERRAVTIHLKKHGFHRWFLVNLWIEERGQA